MKKSFFKFAGLALTTVLALVIAGCSSDTDSHTHIFATDLTSDATYHWYASTCGHTDQVKDKAEHSFGEWTVTAQPTEEAEGSKERECFDCHYKATEAIAQLDHTHKFATDLTSDATYHWYASTCGHTEEVANKAEHTWDAGTVTKAPTEEAEGEKTYKCTVCKREKKEAIAKLSHIHKYAESWTSDETYHWHAATCGHTTEAANKTEHTWDAGTVTKAPTEEAEGEKTYKCTVCNKEKKEAIAKLDHVHAKGTFHAAVSGNCVDKGTVAYYDCTKESCQIKLDESGNPLATIEGEKNPSVHKGEATTWTKTATTHKETYNCCGAVKIEAAHTFGAYISNNDATTSADGTKTHTCTVTGCGYVETVTDVGSKIQIVATPVFSVASGEVESGTSVTISSTTTGATIYYTTNGSTPTTASTRYTGAISLTSDVTIKAIAVKSGMANSAVASASWTIKPDYSTCKIGDFILKDGTILSKDSTPQSGTVAAVIVRVATEGKPALGIGIYNKSGLTWCKSDAIGYSTNISALLGDKTTGYMDGNNSWNILTKVCSDAKEHPEYYPAWNFSLTYAETYKLEGNLANGWYLPTVAELYTIYKTRGVINSSLKKAGGYELGTGWYWSCCQNSNKNYAQVFYFNDSADCQSYLKVSTTSYNTTGKPSSVCSVRAFN